jgi:K+-sensing histidine kinase KdpD
MNAAPGAPGTRQGNETSMRWSVPRPHHAESSSILALDWERERGVSGAGWRRSGWRQQVAAIGISLALVGLVTIVLLGASRFLDVQAVTIVYLIPVLVAATRWGVMPAVIASIAGIGASAFFFYPPIYDFRVSQPEHLVDLVLFIFVAVITGQLAAQSRQAKIRAEAERLREALIDSVSHELKTPLSTVVGSASVLAQAASASGSPQLTELAAVVRDAAERLNSEIENLLDATRISHEQLQPQAEWVDPGDVMNAALARTSRLLVQHHVDVTIEESLPLTRVDPVMIERALTQLIDNAAKYSPAGSRIEIAARRSGDSVAISVKDLGVGLTAAELSHVWDRFFRGSQVRDRVAGSGLGLWIAKAFVTACGGRVDAASEPGRGTVFTVTLPAPSRPMAETADD